MPAPERLRVSETFCSLQGEGPGLGQPSFFLRLALCNLHCNWCDTPYTWDWSHHSYSAEVKERTVDEVAHEISQAQRQQLVITGGEPLLQQRALALLLELLPTELSIEVETNGTVVPGPELLGRVNQWNLSPKLGSAGDPVASRLKPEILRVFLGTGRAWLKLVVDGSIDLEEAEALIAALDWPRSRVLLMPQARTQDELRARTPWLAAACIARNLRLSPRLHLELWGGRRGV